MHLQLEKDFLQVQDNDYSILKAAKKQLKVFLLLNPST